MKKLPETYLNNMRTLLKDEYEAYLASFDRPAVSSIRINEHKISVEDFLKISPFKLSPIPWIHNGFYVEDESRPGKHPYYDAGLYYIQEASAMTPAECLPIEEGDIVLDCCAAPGGKSSELLNKLNGSGLLLANDISSSRAYTMLKNLQRSGHENMMVTAEDVNVLAKQFPGFFTKILVDAPCSGEGMFHKDDSLIDSWLEKGNDYYVKLQKEIICSAASMLKDGGMMLYSTCTFSPSENEEVIEYLLEQYPDFQVIKTPIDYEGFAHGLSKHTKDSLRLYPHRLRGEGHFVCLLQKGESKAFINKHSKATVTPEYLKTILNKHDFSYGQFTNVKDRLYCSVFDNKKLRTLANGLYLGDLKKDRFEPSQALAMALRKEECKQVLTLSLDDPRVNKYLKGETIELDSPAKGYVLVCLENWPLGFGKADNMNLKNKIDKGWIRA